MYFLLLKVYFEGLRSVLKVNVDRTMQIKGWASEDTSQVYVLQIMLVKIVNGNDNLTMLRVCMLVITCMPIGYMFVDLSM